MLRASLRASWAAAALILGAGGTAAAQPQTSRPGVATVCVGVNGELLAPDCHRGVASRLDAREDICLCRRGQRTEASLCPPGVPPPPDSLAVARARNQALRDNATLVGASWQGQPLCVAPHAP